MTTDTETLLEALYGAEVHLRDAARELSAAEEGVTVHTHAKWGETVAHYRILLSIFADVLERVSRELEADDE